MTTRTIICLAMILSALAAGCRHVPAESPAATSSFAFVETPPPPAPPPKAGVAVEPKAAALFDDFQEALPIYPLTYPVYPAHALKQKAGLACVGVRVTVDARGQVTEVGPSVVAFTTPGPFADEFFAAVAATVRQWRFRPARIEHVETVQAAGIAPYSRVLSSEKVETHFDLAFTFTAAGTVLGAEPGK